MNLFQLFLAGGVFMWPILFCSVLALAIALWQGLILIKFHNDLASFARFIETRGASSTGRLVKLDALAFAKQNILRELQLASERVQLIFDRVGKPLEFISALGGIAPLLGFLGTVSGMIGAFQTIAAADKVSVKLVAGGIAEAMITTGFGLCVAIPCLFFESAYRYYLSSQANKMTELFGEAEADVNARAEASTDHASPQSQ